MQHLSVKLGLAPLALFCCAGCVNDDYDLSDIDTTSRISVEDLVIPANLDVVTLGDIITFDENSKIKPVTIDGRQFYALTETGDFESEPIEITKVMAPAPHPDPTEAWLDQLVPGRSKAPSIDPSTGAITYVITEMGNSVYYNAGHIDDAIVSLDHITADISLSMQLQALNAGSSIKNIIFNDLVIQLPKGLDAEPSEGEYDHATGLWTIGHKETDATHASISIHATGVDFKAAGVGIDENHTFIYDGEFKILSGYLTITPDLHGSLPASLHFRVDYGMTDIEASAFSGIVNYKLDGLDIAPVSLGDIPDFLACEGTNITLANPQIYLQVNNPVADNGLHCTTGITLTAIREGGADLSFSPEAPITIPCNHGNGTPYNFVLTPDRDNFTAPDKFKNDLLYIYFPTLGHLLATPEGYPVTGLPQSIGIRLDDPQIPSQPVVDFGLGRSLPAVKGSYELLAPLALTKDSQIIYTETENGWNDEDVDAITITRLSLNATVTNSCPVGAELFAWPIDINGNRINGVEIKSSHLDANSSDVPVTIEMTGTVQHLDGVIFEARLEGSSNNEALTPAQTIVVKNIRARVSGYYEKEL